MYKSVEEMVKNAFDRTMEWETIYECWYNDVEVYKNFLKENYPKLYEDKDYTEYSFPENKKIIDFVSNLSNEEIVEIKTRIIEGRLNVIDIREPECPIVGAPTFNVEKYSDPKICWRDHPIHKIGGKNGDQGHIQPDWGKVLELGLVGILEEINQYHNTYFYNSSKRSIKAIINFLKRLENICLSKGFTKEAQICKNLQTDKPKTFHEALELLFVMYIAFWHCEEDYWLCFGKLDLILYPFYKNDIEKGIITRHEALKLIEYYFIELAASVNRHNGMSLIIGGKDKKGNLVCNDVSYLILDAKKEIGLDNPAPALAYYEGMDEDFLNKCIDTFESGSPAIFNGDLIEKAFREFGVSEEDSYIWGSQTCEEVAPMGTSNVWSVSPIMYAPLYLLDTIKSLKDNKCVSNINEIKNIFLARFGFEIDQSARENSKNWQKNLDGKCAHPILNCFVADCLKRGKDYMAGGAKYNWVCNVITGMTTCVDSLYALDKVVFKEKLYTLSEFYNILENNFEGHEELLAKIRKFIAFGNDNDEIDKIAVELYDFAQKRTEANTICGNRYVMGAFGYLFHIWGGKITGATPDGRLKGEAYSDGIGASQGRDINGPTSLINSVFKIDQSKMLGGTVLNLKFNKEVYKDRKPIKDIIKTYMANGGFQTQINIVDAKDLIEAQKDPDNHRDLIVRVAGYSDYFVALDKECQEEIIKRTEM